MSNIFKTLEYKLIQEHYENQVAKRSGVPLINHIHEGLMILDFLFIEEYTNVKEAYCLHPLLQSDEALEESIKKHKRTIVRSPYENEHLGALSLVVAMEYRNIANQYLSHRTINNLEEIALSPLFQVNEMLIADKVQNRKDFELYHEGSHPRSAELSQYFKNWLNRLGVSESTYQYYKNALIQMEAWQFLAELSNGNGAEKETVVYVFRDTKTKNKFRFDLVDDSTFKVLHSHILESDDGGYKIHWENPRTSAYWKNNTFIIGTYVDGESHRGMKEDWKIDFSEWIK